MSKSLQWYNAAPNQSTLSKVTRSLAWGVSQGQNYAELKLFYATIRGRIAQIQADAILVHELGFSPRRKVW